AIIIPRFVYGVQMCNISTNTGAESLSLDCQCAYPCPADAFEQLDSTEPPSDFHVALDWIHGAYYWAGHNHVHGAVGVFDIATKRRRVLFSGTEISIRPTEIQVEPTEGFLFWIDSWRQAIVRTDTDGRNLK
ncbi:low density lipoprotein receptor, partial [Aphelenchoides avenae]